MRLLHTKPLHKVAEDLRKTERYAYAFAHAHIFLIKTAGTPTTTHSLAGTLFLSKGGWLMLSVPNALVRGAFDALNESGAELPYDKDGTLDAHISVMRPEEIAKIGGPDKLTERGHQMSFTLGPVQEVAPDSWEGISKVWFIQVKSKDLQDLRKAHGLSPRPNDNKFEFHITIGRRKKNVLKFNDIAKEGEDLAAKLEIDYFLEQQRLDKLAGVPGALAPLAIEQALGTSKPDPDEDEDVKEELAKQDAIISAMRNKPTTTKPNKRKLPIKYAEDLSAVDHIGVFYKLLR